MDAQLRWDDNDGPLVFEINARLSGSTEMRVAIGCNDPLRLVRHFGRGDPIARACPRLPPCTGGAANCWWIRADRGDAIAGCHAAVFDCAGTLLRLDPPTEQIFRDAAAELGLDIALAEIARAYEIVNFARPIKSSALTTQAKKDAFYAEFNRSLCVALGSTVV